MRVLIAFSSVVVAMVFNLLAAMQQPIVRGERRERTGWMRKGE
jgi:hypothetical protein